MTARLKTKPTIWVECPNCREDFDFVEALDEAHAVDDQSNNGQPYYRFMLSLGGFSNLRCANCGERSLILEAGPTGESYEFEVNKGPLKGKKVVVPKRKK